MALGTPQGPTASQWKVTAQSVATVADYPVTFQVEATTDNPDAAGMADIVQAFVDLIAQSTGFKVVSASRAYSYAEQITPTA
ncbi:hypothetical protein [Streptomyces cylindrosporus]|uniref:Uncharacterized protein n=1 Tax=Streptomyces cylindrosporus TaxID=2927583 RepID=A0ABS9Y4N4_9ACTN|nr:hypothetical protein [Streptomyces cylindrosporus]MCI3272154.1 hypothetical protein [Streptomyces cylindrosporus]